MLASSLNIVEAPPVCFRSTPGLHNRGTQLEINLRPAQESFTMQTGKSGLRSETPRVEQSKAK